MSQLLELPIDQVVADPTQPRRRFDKAGMARLATSLSEKGLIQPIVVRESGGRYVIISGERRWQAAKSLGWTTISAICRGASKDLGPAINSFFELAVAENTVRENLTPLEEALAYKRLREEHGRTIAEVANIAGVSTTHVTDILRILDLQPAVLEMFDRRRLPVGSVPLLLQLPTEDLQVELARHFERGMSLREAGDWVVKAVGRPPTPPKGPPLESPYTSLTQRTEEEITLAFDWRAKVHIKGRKGFVSFPFNNLEELVKLRRRLCEKC